MDLVQMTMENRECQCNQSESREIAEKQVIHSTISEDEYPYNGSSAIFEEKRPYKSKYGRKGQEREQQHHSVVSMGHSDAVHLLRRPRQDEDEQDGDAVDDPEHGPSHIVALALLIVSEARSVISGHSVFIADIPHFKGIGKAIGAIGCGSGFGVSCELNLFQFRNGRRMTLGVRVQFME